MGKFKTFWCSWFHGGGDVKRDAQDRINWQCRKCGRWSVPVTQEEEEDAAIEESLKERNND
jgi:hypothetical protein